MIFTALLFIALGILIKYGKFYNLIAGYNTMSKEEQAKYDIDKIATLFRNVMFFMAFVILIGNIIATQMNNEKIEIFSISLAVLIGIPYLLIKSNSKKYKKSDFD